MHAARDYRHGMFNHITGIEDKYHSSDVYETTFPNQPVSLLDPSSNNQLFLWRCQVYSGALLAGIATYPFGTVKNDDQTLGLWMEFSATRKRLGDIKIVDHLMAVIVMCHFNDLSKKQLSGTGVLYWCIITVTHGVVIRATAFFFPVDINSSSCTGALDDLCTSQYLCVYSLIKTWIICAYAICDA